MLPPTHTSPTHTPTHHPPTHHPPMHHPPMHHPPAPHALSTPLSPAADYPCECKPGGGALQQSGALQQRPAPHRQQTMLQWCMGSCLKHTLHTHSSIYLSPQAFAVSDWSDVCLAHLFTYQQFTDGRLGLAYIASTSTAGGICSTTRKWRGKREGGRGKGRSGRGRGMGVGGKEGGRGEGGELVGGRGREGEE